MKLFLLAVNGQKKLACEHNGSLRDLSKESLPLSIAEILVSPDLRRQAEAAAGEAPEIDPASVTYLPPIQRPGKIICVGLNYADHAKESGAEKPAWPIFFLRVATTLVGHEQPIIKPSVSDQLDYEGEMVAVIGKPGRAISESNALDHVTGYSIFNEASVRDYQFHKGPQWTAGKNFDATGGFGPSIVSADEVAPGGNGLAIKTRLNGEVMQDGTTVDMMFKIPELIARASEVMTLETGDIIVSGTPAGVGFARKPPVFMRGGDVCEVEIEGMGILRNPIKNES